MDRREFLRVAGLTTGALPFTGLDAHGLTHAVPMQASALYDLFREPAMRYRPMVRWWWNGDRVTAAEVLRELDVMQAAGIGGVEINPIRFPAEADAMGIEALTWMSDEWIEVLKAALAGTRQRGMTCDMIVGSGWPYGGEFLSREDQTQMVALGTRNLSGPARIRISRAELIDQLSVKLVSSYPDSLKELFGLTLVPAQLSDLKQAIPLDSLRSQDSVEIDVPAGDHVLYYLVRMTGYMAVINGAPGANGPVLNHYSGPAVERYLDRLSTRLSAKIGPLKDHFRAFFTDSIELEGANWCDDMFAEFKRRRGYELAPWLPLVLFKVGEMGNAVAEPYGASVTPALHSQVEQARYDFQTTKHELFQERFVATFAAWCTRNGVRSRMQAYGMDCDPITAGMMIDIPECETWIRTEAILPFGSGDDTQGRSYTMINKFVSSAAHLAGKQLISCEEMTNTDDPFHASLERIKVAGDQSMLSGVTQSVLHGFNYSPLNAPFPGWVRYGTYFSERNPWWPSFKLWADYKARLSAIFQQSVMQAQVAILPPAADLAARYGFQRDPFPQTTYPAYLNKLWEVVHQNGSGCDYLNEEVIGRSTVRAGRLHFNNRAYRTVILPEVDSLHPATARQLAALVESGGTILFLDRVPTQSAGLIDHVAGSQAVRECFERMRREHPERTPIATVRQENMVGWYGDLCRQHGFPSDVALDQPTDFISQLHYVSGEHDLYFFTHYGPQPAHSFKAKFSLKDRTPWLWNPETGERTPYPVEADHSLRVTLGPSESKLIVFEPGRAAPAKATPASPPVVSVITTPWTATFHPVNGTMQTRTFAVLADLAGTEAFKSFAGTIVYTNELKIDGRPQRVLLQLGHLHSVTRLEVNGQPIGSRWYGEHTYDITHAVHPGDNRMSLTVITTLGNYMKTLTDNKAARAWTENTPFAALGLTQPVSVAITP